MTRTRIKICGVTRAEDAAACAATGADAVGVVLAASPRRVDAVRAAEVLAAARNMRRVGVFVDPALRDVMHVTETCSLDFIQLCGDEPARLALALPRPVLRTVQLRTTADLRAAAGYPARAFILDAPATAGTRGGSGRTFDWSLASALPWTRARTVIAGGLTPDNVGEAVLRMRPGAVDVSSGVESAPGIKDGARIIAFVEAVRRADSLLDVGESTGNPFE